MVDTAARFPQPLKVYPMNIPFLTPALAPELDLRLEKIRRIMKTGGTGALLIGGTSNMFYLSGCVFRGYIYVPADRSPLFLCIEPSVSDQAGAVRIRKPEMIPDALSERGYEVPSKLGIEFSDLLYSDATRLMKVFPGVEFTDASCILREARMVKTPYEIKMLREDGVHHVRVYSQIEHCYQDDMTDLELQIEIERVLRREGCLGFLRAAGSRMELNLGSVLSGDNADVPTPYDFALGGGGVSPSLPVGADGTTMKPGSTVMIDMNGGFNGYQTDMTRTWMIEDVPEIAKKAHQCSVDILRELEKMAKPGVEIGSLARRASEMVRERGLEAYFMGHIHHAGFIGHGVGIELNEAPVVMERNRQPLVENMTIALEPKFVIPHVGAVGIENTYRVGPDGLENLTPFREDMDDIRN